MLDFMTIATKVKEKEMCTEVFPKFIMKKSKDLMIRGRDFYAIWDDEQDLSIRKWNDGLKTTMIIFQVNQLLSTCGMLTVE